MKYIKLFENFRDDREDPKWIITSALTPIEVDEVPFDKEYGDTSMFRLFELSEEPSEDKINHLKSWLEGEGYYFHSGKYKTDLKTSIFRYKTNNGIIVTDKPIREVCIDWLKVFITDMEKVESIENPGCILYRYNERDNIIIYDKKMEDIYVSPLIFSFFENYFDFKIEESIILLSSTMDIIKDCLKIDGKLTLLNKGSVFQLCK